MINRPPGCSTRRGLGDRAGRVFGVVQHHLQHRRVERRIGQRQPVHVRQPHPAMRQPQVGRRGRARARASIAFDASTPSPWRMRGANSSSTRPVPVPMSSSRPGGSSGTRVSSASSTACAGEGSRRAHLVPVRAFDAEAFGSDAGAFGQDSCGLTAVGLQDRIVRGQPRDEVSGEPAAIALRQSEPDIRPLSHPVQQAAIAQ